MNLPHVDRYKNVQIQTGSPGEILVALFDGLFRFLAMAKHALENNKPGVAAETLGKAYAIVSELYVSLDHAQYPELCKNLEAIYDFAMQRIGYANAHRDVTAIQDAMRALRPIREAFTTVVRNDASR